MQDPSEPRASARVALAPVQHVFPQRKGRADCGSRLCLHGTMFGYNAAVPAGFMPLTMATIEKFVGESGDPILKTVRSTTTFGRLMPRSRQ